MVRWVGWFVLGVCAWSPLANAQPAQPTAGEAAEGEATDAEPFTIIEVPPAPALSPEQPAPPPEPVRAPTLPLRLRDPQVEDEPRRKEPPSEWYGWQTLTVDLSSLVVMLAAPAMDEDAGGPVVVGLAGYAFGTPIVHAVHGNSWALPSLGMRVGSLVLMGTGIYVALSGCFFLDDESPRSCDDRQIGGALLFFTGLAGALAAIPIDAVLARATPTRPETPTVGVWGDPLTGTAGISLSVVR